MNMKMKMDKGIDVDINMYMDVDMNTPMEVEHGHGHGNGHNYSKILISDICKDFNPISDILSEICPLQSDNGGFYIRLVQGISVT
jgi:hypothetical protein